MSKNDQAFPGKVVIGIKGDEWVYTHSPGMTLRDWFAGQAVVGLLTAHHTAISYPTSTRFAEDAAKVAFIFADAMLAERRKQP
jgi:hypothetical protein